MTAMPFRANPASVRYRHGIGDHNGTNVAVAQDLERSLNRSHRYDSIARMCQNGIADRGQHPFCGDRKD